LPIYEYKCEGCGEVFEVIQKFADEPVTLHEKCGGHVHRLMSAPSFQFKGSGWYVTDYAKGSGGGPGKGESNKGDSKGESDKSDSASKTDSASKSDASGKTSSDTSAKTESKSESKPAASSDKSKSD
jgi:putative FmdB family regulatory protein